MNIFVLCTGRCGSTTFTKACSHISNFTSSHESRCKFLGDERFLYPNNHIEVDNRLTWLMGRLDQKYGNAAFYVHLRREDSEVATSFLNRYERGIIRAYRGDGIIMGLSESANPMEVSLDYCKTVNENITLFLKDKDRKMEFHLDSYEADFPRFWEQICAQGDFEKALSEFSRNYNGKSVV